MLFSLSRKMTDKDKVRRLGTIGLEVAESYIDSQLYNERYDIKEAALQILKEWRSNQVDSKVAHTQLCVALKKVDLSSWICVLKPNASYRG